MADHNRLPRESLEEIELALKEHEKAWENLKRVRETFKRVEDLDEALVEYKRVWLKLDTTVDDRLQMHTVLWWKDPDVYQVCELCTRIQTAVSKLDGDGKRETARMVERELEALEAKL